MPHPGEQLDLTVEAPILRGVADVDELDRDSLSGLLIDRGVDGAHPAIAQGRVHAEPALSDRPERWHRPRRGARPGREWLPILGAEDLAQVVEGRVVREPHTAIFRESDAVRKGAMRNPV